MHATHVIILLDIRTFIIYAYKEGGVKLTEQIKMNPQPLACNSLPSYHPLPFYLMQVTAGFPSPALDYTEKSLDLNEHLILNPISTFFMHATNDALKESGILADDLLIVDRSLKPQSGDIVISVIAGELCARRFEKHGQKIILKTDEDFNEPFFLTADNEIQIWGVVTTAIHSL